MSEKLLVQKVRTNKGDIPIDYNCLENAPKFDADWKSAHGIADKDAVNNALATKAEKTDLDGLTGIQDTLKSIQDDLGRKAYSTEIDLHRVEVDNQFSTLQMVTLPKYVTQKSLEEAAYVTELQLDEYMDDNGYVTNSKLSSALKTAGYPTATSISTVGHTHTLDNLTDVIIMDSMPTTVENGKWYLVKVAE